MPTYHKPGGLKQQVLIFSQMWRPEVQNQGAGRAVLSLEAPGEDPSCLFQLLGAPGIHWLVAASPPSLVSVLTPSSPLCVSRISLCLTFVRARVTEFRGNPDNPGLFHLKILNFSISENTLFLAKTMLTGCGVGCGHTSLRGHVQPTVLYSPPQKSASFLHPYRTTLARLSWDFCHRLPSTGHSCFRLGTPAAHLPHSLRAVLITSPRLKAPQGLL